MESTCLPLSFSQFASSEFVEHVVQLGARVKITCSGFSYSSNSEFVSIFFCGLTLASEQTRAGCIGAKKMRYAIESLFGFIQTILLPAYERAK